MDKKTVLALIEDDPHDVELTKAAFKGAPGHLQLLHVGDAWDAVRYLKGEDHFADREKFPLPDVILLDLKMPGFDGFDFLQWLRASSPDHQRLLPVIVMSSSTLQKDVSRAYEFGISAYIAKPMDFSAFKERLKLLGLFWSDHVETPEVHDAGG
jgi:CheY-like chemotaxis protein